MSFAFVLAKNVVLKVCKKGEYFIATVPITSKKGAG